MSAADEVESGVRALITGGILYNHQVADRLGLPLLDLQALNLLALSGGQSSPSALAAALRTPRSSVSRLVARLEEAGYVTRRRAPTDGRGLLVVADPVALHRVTAEYAGQADRLRSVLEEFEPDEVATIDRFLRAITARPDRGPAHG